LRHDGRNVVQQEFDPMSAAADPSHPARVPMPERTPAAIRAELPAELRRQFEAEYQAALEDARQTYQLTRLDQVIETWWRTVWARRHPGHQQRMEYGMRLLRGEAVEPPPTPMDLDALFGKPAQ
jgi:hypothetical protein